METNLCSLALIITTATIICHTNFVQVQPKAVEMVPGYGVFLTQRQLDAALDGAKDSPTRLMRNLIGTFFTPEVLGVSSVYGTGRHVALDRDVVDTCIRKYTHIFFYYCYYNFNYIHRFCARKISTLF